LQLPPRAPELNGQENNGQFIAAELAVEPNFQILRRHRRSLLLAWNTLIDQPWKIMSIARRDWAAAGNSI
jgi:hypothetical protein